MLSKTAVVCAVSTALLAYFLPLKYAFLVGFLAIIPLRLTIFPGNLFSQTGMVASALTTGALWAGLKPLAAILLAVLGREVLLILIFSLLLKQQLSLPFMKHRNGKNSHPQTDFLS